MKISETELPGLLIIEPHVFEDERGCFLETWHQERYRSFGIDASFVQDNVSFSRYGVLRGLHYQNPVPQGKLISVLHGLVFDVAVDLRVDSPGFGQWAGIELSAGNRRQFYVPKGFAHGFVVLSESALVAYKCTAPYTVHYDRVVRWNDPELGVRWPITDPVLSVKDRSAPLLRDIPAEYLFHALS